MARMARSDMIAKREAVVKDKENVLRRYRDGESLNSLRRAYGVSWAWLTAQFDEWQEPRRGLAQAAVARGAVGSPPLPRNL
ncbi:hypothetical protein ABT234_05285 [Streptomyces sp. NPDC001586]|uniref:hypothetical protein n=1 Tax=unclassified Streptomyces TaxID=2593676 RepID=UPI0033342201